MLKSIVCVVCLFLTTGQVFGEQVDVNPIPYEDLTLYTLSKEELSLLKESLALSLVLDAGTLGSLATEAVVGDTGSIMQKFNRMSREERTKDVFFILTNSETRPYIDFFFQDKAKLQLFRYILGYLERDMELELFEFSLLRQNVSALASMLLLDESVLITFLDQKNYVEFFLYWGCPDYQAILDQE